MASSGYVNSIPSLPIVCSPQNPPELRYVKPSQGIKWCVYKRENYRGPQIYWARIGHEIKKQNPDSSRLLGKRGNDKLTLNQWVPGSSPGGVPIESQNLPLKLLKIRTQFLRK